MLGEGSWNSRLRRRVRRPRSGPPRAQAPSHRHVRRTHASPFDRLRPGLRHRPPCRRASRRVVGPRDRPRRRLDARSGDRQPRAPEGGGVHSLHVRARGSPAGWKRRMVPAGPVRGPAHRGATLQRGAGAGRQELERLRLGTDATINLRSSRSGTVNAPLVFIGYGIRAPEQGHDDFKGLDLRGQGGGGPGGSRAGRTSRDPRSPRRGPRARDALQEGGAVGVLTIASPHADIPWDRYVLSRLHPQMRLKSDTGAPGRLRSDCGGQSGTRRADLRRRAPGLPGDSGPGGQRCAAAPLRPPGPAPGHGRGR